MIERTVCGGLIERHDLCLVEVMGYVSKPGRACRILGLFSDAGIPLHYLTIGNDVSERCNLAFCVGRPHRERTDALLAKVKQAYAPRGMNVHEPVSILTLYGPHFYERIALASGVYDALCCDAIDTLSLGSSVNSISVVVATVDLERTKESLRKRFTWPE